jgi:opacity protein-like surface antigen
VGETWTYSGEGDDNNNRKVIDANKAVSNREKNKNSNFAFYGGDKITLGEFAIKEKEKYCYFFLCNEMEDKYKYSQLSIGIGGGVKYNVNDKVFIGGETYLNYALTNHDEEWKTNRTDNYRLFGLSVEINAIVGYNITEQFNVYGLLGGVILNDKFNAGQIELFVMTPQFGFGVGFNPIDDIGMKLQYTSSNSDYKVCGYSAMPRPNGCNYDGSNDNKVRIKNSNISLITNLMF